VNIVRTEVRKLSKGLYIYAGLFDILKIDKNSTDLQCFIFQFRGLGALFWGTKTAKAPSPRGDRTKYR